MPEPEICMGELDSMWRGVWLDLFEDEEVLFVQPGTFVKHLPNVNFMNKIEEEEVSGDFLRHHSFLRSPN